MKISSKRQDYRQYQFDEKEKISAAALSAAVVLFLAWFFYRSLWAVLVLSPLGWLILKMQREEKGEKRRQELAEQFKECILSVSASLQAGYAVENAFLESREDMEKLYGTGSMIYQELETIRRGLVINIPLEEQLLDLGERSGTDDILQFAQMFAIAKRGGGSIPEMIRTSANLISQKTEARQEVRTILAGRKMEQNIMRLMPFGIVSYVGSTYPGYFSPLYHNLTGVGIMSLCLLLYLAAVWLGERIFQGIWGQLEGLEKKERIIALERNGILGKMAVSGERLFLWLQGRLKKRIGREEMRRCLELLYPDEPREELLVRYYGGKLGFSAAVFLTGLFLSGCLLLKELLVQGEIGTALRIFGLGSGAAAAVYFLMDKDLGDQVKKKKDRLRMAYPDLVHRLALYLVSGMTIRHAFTQLGKTNSLAGYACREMQAGMSETTAYEHFGKRAGPREYVKLSTLLCQNLKKGNSTLLHRLEEEAGACAESRIQNGKILGEEAGTKLLVPMAMLLAVVMLLVMVPAFSMIVI